MAKVGELTIDLGANLSRLRTDMDEANRVVKRGATQIESVVTGMKAALGGLLAGFSIQQFAQNVQASIKSMDDLNDVADVTGESVERISALMDGLAAHGHGPDVITDALSRVQRAMQGADDESKGAGEAFAAMGVKTRDANGNLRPTIDVLLDVSKALGGYKDGSNKAALANAALLRGGAGLLPMLKDLGETGLGTARTTTKQAQEAEAAARALNKFSHEASIARNQLVSQMLPALTELIGKFNAARAAGLSFWQSAGFALDGSTDNAQKELERAQKGLDGQKKLLAEFEAMPKVTRTINDWVFGDEADLKRGIAFNEQRIAASKALISANEALAASAAAAKAGESTPQKDAPTLTGGDGASRAKKEAAERERIAQLQKDAVARAREELALAGEKSALAQAYYDLTQGKEAKLLAPVRQQLYALAQQTDERKRFLEQEKRLIEKEYDLGAEMSKISDEMKRRDQDRREADRLSVEEMVKAGPAARANETLRQLELLKAAREAGTIGSGAYQDAVNGVMGLSEAAKESKDVFKELGATFESAFEKAIDGGADLRNIMKGLMADVSKMVLRQTVTGPMMGWVQEQMKGMGGAGGTSIGGLFGTAANLLGGLFGGARAAGGPVESGRTYLVGERGPELLTMGRNAGHITPNHAMGGGQVIVQQTLNVGANADFAMVRTAAKLGAEEAQAKFADARRRGMAWAG